MGGFIPERLMMIVMICAALYDTISNSVCIVSFFFVNVTAMSVWGRQAHVGFKKTLWVSLTSACLLA